MVRGLGLALAGLLLVAAGASAQAYWQPHPAPLVTAENEPWFQLGEPLTFEGYFYYPAGARVFFDGNIMVRSGSYRGIPLYTDTTIEAYSRVFVPLRGGLLQPYERRRTGDAAGTTGSRAPSFPVTMAGDRAEEPAATGTAGALMSPAPEPAAGMVSNSGGPAAGASKPARNVIGAGLKAKGLNEVYLTYAGYRWRAAGPAARLSDARFEVIGRYRGYPVYADRADLRDPRVIYVPSRPGLVAPYERAGKPPKY
jgi:hypothetical protein